MRLDHLLRNDAGRLEDAEFFIEMELCGTDMKQVIAEPKQLGNTEVRKLSATLLRGIRSDSRALSARALLVTTDGIARTELFILQEHCRSP